MSLEQKIEELTKAVEANTAAILASQGKTTTTTAPAADNKGEPEKPKGKPGRKPKNDPAPAPATDESDDPFADEGDDPFADDSGETERTYTAEDIKALIFKVRKEKSDKDALAIIEAQGVKTLGQIKEDQYPAVVAAAKKLGVTL